MAFNYRFSVGTLTVGTNDLGIMTDIAVSYDGDPQTYYGGDYRLPVAIELGNRTGEITATGARYRVDGGQNADGPLDNQYHTVTLAAGANSGGLVATITYCKVTSYNVTSTQADFITSDLTMLMASPDSSPTTSGSWPSWIST